MEAEIQILILNCILFEVYQQKKKQKNEIEDADVFNNQASKSKINTLSGYMNHEGKDTNYKVNPYASYRPQIVWLCQGARAKISFECTL